MPVITNELVIPGIFLLQNYTLQITIYNYVFSISVHGLHMRKNPKWFLVVIKKLLAVLS